jgi:hypothetical protein
MTYTVKRNSAAGRLALDEILSSFAQNGLIHKEQVDAISALAETDPFEAAQLLVVHMKSNDQDLKSFGQPVIMNNSSRSACIPKIMNNSRVSAYNPEKRAA